ncbi:biotin synthase [Gammaproteobacteria bacterium]
MFEAHRLHRASFDPNQLQASTLLSIKTGACPEDCGYCAQSARHDSGLSAERLLGLDEVMAAAQAAKAQGATRFCMGAAWRGPTGKNLERVADMVAAVHHLGLETCVTLGMLGAGQAERLRAAGLDYYNHNLDTSPEYYGRVIHSHGFEERLNTLAEVRAAGIRVCSGGIIGMGESRNDRAGLLQALANLPEHPESVPINLLVPIPGTPLADAPPLDALELVRTIAVARCLMPRSDVRLSAGRATMSDELQALCFFAGANSVFFGDRLLTADNPETTKDLALFQRLGLRFETAQHGAIPETAPEPARCAI